MCEPKYGNELVLTLYDKVLFSFSGKKSKISPEK